jgi:PAS domain S-box-containing protein
MYNPQNSERLSVQTLDSTPVELEFKALADKAPVMIWMSEAPGIYSYFNEGWLEFRGASLREELNSDITEAIHPEDLKKYTHCFSQAFETKQEFKTEYRLKRCDGEHRWILDHGVPRYNSKGHFKGYIGSCFDITEMKELEKKKAEFVNAASHELKTPVTTMKLYLHMLQDHLRQKDDTVPLGYVDKISDQVKKLSTLINEMLDLSRIDTNKLRYHYELFDYSQFMKELKEEFQHTELIPDIELVTTCHENIKGDRILLKQAVVNLLDNALKFSKGHSRIIITVSLQGNSIKTTVTDFGIGIAEQHHGKIFDRFYRVTGIRKSTYPGLGLGLFLSKEIIKNHGGEIWVESEEGKGTTVYFTLPIPD